MSVYITSQEEMAVSITRVVGPSMTEHDIQPYRVVDDDHFNQLIHLTHDVQLLSRTSNQPHLFPQHQHEFNCGRFRL